MAVSGKAERKLFAAVGGPVAQELINHLASLTAGSTTTFGVFGVGPVTRASAYTQTYATADKTHADPTSAALVLTATNIAAKTASATLTDAVNTNAGTVATSLDQAQKDLGTMINALRVDVLDLKQLVNSVIDDLQAYGILQ
jgi:multisubunit Na+/H+ antiporter MnhC subunit